MSELTREQKFEIYRLLRLNRTLEEKLVNLYRQGKVVGGLYRSLGQEATSVGTAYALSPGDVLGPLIRNLGSVLVMGFSPRDVLAQHMARASSPSGGKDCNLHFGAPERGVISSISMLGALVPVMAGIALGARLQKKNVVAMTYIGDGGTSTGAFHEGLNFAAVQKLPLVVVAENNGWAYSTPFKKQTAARCLADRAAAYGIPGETVDGNDVLAVYEAAKRAVARARAGDGPTLLEAKTYRMKGHAEHDGQAYVPSEELAEWAARDPLEAYSRVLAAEGLATADDLGAIDAVISERVEADASAVEQSPFPAPESALEGVYARKVADAEPAVARRRS
ncbi:MAG: thiamine pyrophosphate-dependent dehydrogenase E1 component subunit alpha [Acidobacteria bacterium]|nr:thiamine pyrophosphate-dependent dehydrogenase E1 component subunit alpha [Acidobacteriota bacterium]MCA1610634.1 thiamine pyrophosphate-dependent dehydrogenase E1 component subunit alpha [Acidobacteriota bacterium]